MFVTLFPMVTEVKPLQPEKARNFARRERKMCRQIRRNKTPQSTDFAEFLMSGDFRDGAVRQRGCTPPPAAIMRWIASCSSAVTAHGVTTLSASIMIFVSEG